MTALGSAADTGDVGVVGRGNRLNGLITPMRPMSIEAPCGKNPIDHTGKIYGYFCHKLANQIYQELGSPCQVHIQTYKGSPLKKPDDVLVIMDSIPVDNNAVKKLIETELSNISNYINDFVTTNVTMC
ncbi:S-adenosylmethionine synthase [Xenorhabdus miraniensis]|uniref:S-adenosylmethionine synthase n=2 Tax=Xenorhabdus TaxID=626 RepID=A0A2D0JJH1_9GAMM|nr:S-adenosylmethionine synthase [Xenorhabdus miraniensis]